MLQSLRKLYPRAASYDERWVVRNSLGENALINTEAVAERLDLRPGMKVLDLGCGRAISSIFLAKEYGCEVWAVDKDTPVEANEARILIEGVRDRVHPMQADAKNLPFAPSTFDRIIAVDSFLYFGMRRSYLRYLQRFLKRGGRIGVIDGCIATERDAASLARFRFMRNLRSLAWWRHLWRSVKGYTLTVAQQLKESKLILKQYAIDKASDPDERPVVELLREDAGQRLRIMVLVAEKS